MPFENNLFKREYEAEVLPAVITPESQYAMGQQIAFASLGGLRPMVASMLNIDAFAFFRKRDWPGLEKRYGEIVTLNPKNPIYWKQGAEFLGVDAAISYRSREDLPAAERYAGYRSYLKKGRDFLNEGIRANPDDWSLYVHKGQLLSNVYNYPDFEQAAAAYHEANRLGAPQLYQRMEFYCLARVPGKSREAWALGRALFNNKNNRLPSLVTTLFALENRLDIPAAQRIPFNELFPTTEIAREELTLQLTNGLGYPEDGVAEALSKLPPPKESPPQQAPK